MNKKLSFVEILKIIHRCSLTNQTRNQYMLVLIDAMIINEADNPLVGLEDDTLKRIFTGSNPFPREKAKDIYSHRDEVKFITFLRGISPNLFLNIETEIQNIEPDYKQDESGYMLAELIFERLREIAEKPRERKKMRTYSSANLIKENNTLSVMETALIAGEWDESNKKDVKFLEMMSGKTYKTFAKELSVEKGASKVNYPCWHINERAEHLQDLCVYLREDDIKQIFKSIRVCILEENRCSKHLLNGLADFLAFLSNNMNNAQYSKSEYDSCLYAFLRSLFELLYKDLNSDLIDILPILSEVNSGYIISSLSEEAVISSICSINDNHKYHIQEVLLKVGEYDQHFIDAAQLMFRLAENDNYFYKGLLSLFVVWYPRTEATTDKRIGFVKGLIKRNKNIGKQLLFDLLPGREGVVYLVPAILYAKQPLIKQISYKEYWAYETKLVELLFENYKLDSDDISRLIRRLPALSEPLFVSVLDKISECFEDFDEDGKKHILSQLSKTIMTCDDLSEDRVQSMQNIIHSHDYSYIDCLGRELFSYTSVLYVRKSRGAFGSEDELNAARIAKCKSLYDGNGADGIVDFLQTVEDKYRLGVCVFIALGIEELNSVVNKTNDVQFLRGIASQVNSDDLEMILSDKRLISIAKYVTIDGNLMKSIASLPIDKQNLFWSKFDGTSSEKLSDSAWRKYIKLLKRNKRYRKAVSEMYLHRERLAKSMTDDMFFVLSEVALDDDLSDYVYLFVLDELREFDYDNDSLVKLEFLAMHRFERNHDSKPLSVHAKMASDPKYFIDVVEKAYRFESPYCSILREWRELPGTCSSGFDLAAFNIWFSKVNSIADEGIRFSASNAIGESIFSLYEKDNQQFLESEVANILDDANNDGLRAGFISAPEYMITISPDSNEMPMFDCYKSQANLALSYGYINIASALEKIAYRFQRMYKSD